MKVGPNDQVDRFKARLVAKGYTQQYDSNQAIAFVHFLLSMAIMP